MSLVAHLLTVKLLSVECIVNKILCCFSLGRSNFDISVIPSCKVFLTVADPGDKGQRDHYLDITKI